MYVMQAIDTESEDEAPDTGSRLPDRIGFIGAGNLARQPRGSPQGTHTLLLRLGQLAEEYCISPSPLV